MDNNREKVIVQTSIIGILANLFLAGFKAGVGLFSNSISITLDAVNNLTDALSSVITIVGTRLANRHRTESILWGTDELNISPPASSVFWCSMPDSLL